MHSAENVLPNNCMFTQVDLTSNVVIKPLLKYKIDKLSHDIMVHLITAGAVPLVSVCVAWR